MCENITVLIQSTQQHRRNIFKMSLDEVNVLLTCQINMAKTYVESAVFANFEAGKVESKNVMHVKKYT